MFFERSRQMDDFEESSVGKIGYAIFFMAVVIVQLFITLCLTGVVIFADQLTKKISLEVQYGFRFVLVYCVGILFILFVAKVVTSLHNRKLAYLKKRSRIERAALLRKLFFVQRKIDREEKVIFRTKKYLARRRFEATWFMEIKRRFIECGNKIERAEQRTGELKEAEKTLFNKLGPPFSE